MFLAKLIFDNTVPVIGTPPDYTYTENSIGNFIHWTLGDRNPNTYSVMKDGLQYREETTWINRTLNVNIDGLEVGVYTFVITVIDVEGNMAYDTVKISVVEAISYTTSIGDISSTPMTSAHPTTGDPPSSYLSSQTEISNPTTSTNTLNGGSLGDSQTKSSSTLDFSILQLFLLCTGINYLYSRKIRKLKFPTT